MTFQDLPRYMIVISILIDFLGSSNQALDRNAPPVFKHERRRNSRQVADNDNAAAGGGPEAGAEEAVAAVGNGDPSSPAGVAPAATPPSGDENQEEESQGRPPSIIGITLEKVVELSVSYDGEHHL